MAHSILIGNTAQLNDAGSWDWTFYVRPAEYVEQVFVTLHDTFKDPERTLHGPKLELSCTGWGTFELQLVICWKGGGQSKKKWMLRFSQDQHDFHETLAVPVDVLASL